MHGELIQIPLGTAAKSLIAKPAIRIALPTGGERLRYLIEHARSIILTLSSRGTMTTINAVFEQTTGWRAADWVGQPLADLVHPTQVSRVNECLMRLAHGAPTALLEFRLRLGDGRFMETETTVSSYPGGESERLFCIVQDITQRKKAEDELEQSREQLRALASRHQRIREEERNRIAREIHDELGQTLTGLKMDTLWLKTQLAKHAATPNLADLAGRTEAMATVIQDTIQTVRRIATDLRPPVLDKLGLPAAIEWQAQEFARRTGLKLVLDVRLDRLDADDPFCTAVFRIFQEILTNVARHAEATEVRVRLQRRGRSLALTVNDNGRGISEAEITGLKSLGLVGMRERAMVFGGKVEILSNAAGGTTVAVRVPLPQTPSNLKAASAEARTSASAFLP